MKNIYFYVASTYGSCTYSGSTYNNSCATTTAASGSSGGGQLSNTGVDIALFIGIASVLLLTALVVWIWKRPAARPRSK